MYLRRTSLGRIRCFWRFPRLMESITYAFSASLFSPIPTAPTIHLPDGWTLNRNVRGQKGADKADDPVPFFFQRHESQPDLVSSGMNSRAPIAKPFFVNCSGERIRREQQMQATFRRQIEFLPVSHGPGLRLEAILLRRATMIITTTTNRTPAMIRMVVGSIDALSLKYMRHRYCHGLCAYYRTGLYL